MITVAIQKLGNVDNVINFYTEVIASKENIKQFPQYAEIIRLKKQDQIGHTKIARRVAHLILENFHANTIAVQRSLFSIALNHANSLELNEFSEDQVVGKGGSTKRYYIYDLISRFNHSCQPNIETYLNSDDELVCVAAHQILEGEQLFISYLGNAEFESKQDRKSYVKEIWNFDCDCRLCRME